MTDATPTVTPIRDGAHRVKGLEQLQTAGGPVELQSIVALCRCGLGLPKFKIRDDDADGLGAAGPHPT